MTQTIAILEGTPRLNGWWTDLKRSGVGTVISDASDVVVRKTGDVATWTGDAYGDYVRPAKNIAVDTASFVKNVVVLDWKTASRQIDNAVSDTSDFFKRQESRRGPDGSIIDSLPEFDSGTGMVAAGVVGVLALWYFTRNKGRSK